MKQRIVNKCMNEAMKEQAHSGTSESMKEEIPDG